MEKELAPLMASVEEVKKKVASEKRVPSYGTLKEWAQARADMMVAAARGAKRGNGMLEPAQVEVDLSGREPPKTQPQLLTLRSLRREDRQVVRLLLAKLPLPNIQVQLQLRHYQDVEK